MSFCGRCGAQGAAGATYCPKCGSVLKRPAASAPASPPSTTPADSAHTAAPEGPATVAQRQAQRPPAPPQPPMPSRPTVLPPSSISPGGYPSTSKRRRDGVPVVAIAAVVVLVAALGGAAALLINHKSAHARSTRASVSKPAAGGHTQPIQNGAASTESSSAAPAGGADEATAQSSLLALLSTYQTAYSNHDIQGVSRLLTPGVVRHGLTASGCTSSHGRAAVLADYESQFAAGSGTYRLVGLTASKIELRGAEAAHLNGHYQITPGGSGHVSFTFAREGTEWKISQVYATCA